MAEFILRKAEASFPSVICFSRFTLSIIYLKYLNLFLWRFPELLDDFKIMRDFQKLQIARNFLLIGF